MTRIQGKNMKKRWIGVLLLCCVLMICGCGKKKTTQTQSEQNDITQKTGQDVFPDLPTFEPGAGTEESGEVLTEEGDLQQELEIRYDLAAKLPFEAGDDKICAIAYMGDSGEEHEANLTAFYAKYFPDVESSNWEILPNYDCGGAQCYLIIPRYKETVAYVNTLTKSLEGNIEVQCTEIMNQEACLVYCNVAPELANAEVNLLYNDGHFVVVPKLSAIDGRLEPMQVALDLTMEEVYQ